MGRKLTPDHLKKTPPLETLSISDTMPQQKGPWKPVAKGRPKRRLDERLILHLAQIQCTMEEMAAILEVSEETLRRNYIEVIRLGRSQGCVQLRDMQWGSAKNGSWRAQEWLGIQHLGQKSRHDDESAPKSFTVNVLAVPTRDKITEVVTKSQKKIEKKE
jgi:hypothetical protein